VKVRKNAYASAIAIYRLEVSAELHEVGDAIVWGQKRYSEHGKGETRDAQ
jgi:hypothetical protein